MIKNSFSKDKLEHVAQNSLYTTFTNSMTINYSFEVFSRYLIDGNILELGPAEGLMTDKLIALDPKMTVVEGSTEFANKIASRHPSIQVYNELFEDVILTEKYDNIILGHVLEHVADPSIILSNVKKWLKPEGRVFCAVPNARSLHRQVAVEMGLIKSIFDQSEKDVHHGHLRIYSPETLMTEFVNLDYKIYKRGGYWLKPISDSQIEASWSKEMLEGFMKLGENYPDIAGEIYIIAQNK